MTRKVIELRSVCVASFYGEGTKLWWGHGSLLTEVQHITWWTHPDLPGYPLSCVECLFVFNVFNGYSSWSKTRSDSSLNRWRWVDSFSWEKKKSILPPCRPLTHTPHTLWWHWDVMEEADRFIQLVMAVLSFCQWQNTTGLDAVHSSTEERVSEMYCRNRCCWFWQQLALEIVWHLNAMLLSR